MTSLEPQLTPNIGNLKWSLPSDKATRCLAECCLQRTDWAAVCRTASASCGGQPCRALNHHTSGGTSLARLLQFRDGTYCVARVQLRKPTAESARKLRAEIDTLAFLATASRAPVPRVLAVESPTDGRSATFVLLEFLAAGNTALDETRAYKREDWGLIPRQHRETFYRSLAATHAQIVSARLPQIGTIVRNPTDNTFSLGPISGIGGPFDTAAEFIRAWAASARFPYTTEDLRRHLPSSVADEVIAGTAALPSRLASLSSKLFYRPGPFPVRHPDLFLNNLIVAAPDDFTVRGIIDWEGATTVPWELVDAPSFLALVPRPLNPPEQYDQATGQPLDPDEAGRWTDHATYVDMVRATEREAGLDHRLSDVLGDRRVQDLAAAVHLYAKGKMGFYGRVLDELEAELEHD